MDQEEKILGFYNYTVILTYIGMLFGFTGITYTFENNILKAIICLMIAGFCDMFDGTIASTMKRTRQEKCFGIQIDSLSDLICFGVLPSLILFSINRHYSICYGISAMYLLCCLIRLSYFNVDEQERQLHSSSPRNIYYGMPVTMSALFIPIVYCISYIYNLNTELLLSIILLGMAVMFLMPFPLRKPKLIGKMCVILCGIFEIFAILIVCMAA